MYLGTRKIRSAGRTSGSIEVTLPPQLQGLEGTECRLTVRDGPQPEIVLQPDLSASQALFQKLWRKLRLGLSEVDDIGDFSPADFTLTLFPPSHWQERPPLAYVDALALADEPATQKNGQASESLARLLACLAVEAGYRLDLEGALALAFGDAVAYVATGTSAGLGTDFERGMAHRIFWQNGRPQQALVSNPPSEAEASLDDEIWRTTQPGFRRLYDQFRTWQQNPEVYAAARENWYRALNFEMGLRTSTAADYVERGGKTR